jgi:5'-deoxynucleotidase
MSPAQKHYALDGTINGAKTGMELLAFLRRSAQVRRFHTEHVIHHQNTGEHSYSVAWLCWYLCDRAQYKCSAALLLAALSHDAAEHALGDIPSPTKRALGIRATVDALEEESMAYNGLPVPRLDSYETAILKYADALEGLLYCSEEIQRGNRLIYAAYRNFRAYVTELLSKPGTQPIDALDDAVGHILLNLDQLHGRI